MFDVIIVEDVKKKKKGLGSLIWSPIPYFKFKKIFGWEAKLSIYKWKCFYNLCLSLKAKLSDHNSRMVNISGLCSSKRSSDVKEELRAELRLLWPRRGVQASGLLGRVSIKTEMIGEDPWQPAEIASLFWENLRTFPGELMEVEWERKCLGFPAETAVLLNPTTNLQNPRIRNKSKLLFIPYFDFWPFFFFFFFR